MPISVCLSPPNVRSSYAAIRPLDTTNRRERSIRRTDIARARGRRPAQQHRAGQADRSVAVGLPAPGAGDGAQRPDPRLPRRAGPGGDGGAFVAYIAVGLSDHSKASQEAFERSISLAPQVRECHNITGAVEYMLRVEVADLVAYKHFHTEVLGTLPQVNAITSYVVMGSPKDERA